VTTIIGLAFAAAVVYVACGVYLMVFHPDPRKRRR
jgi:hypothetical protein